MEALKNHIKPAYLKTLLLFAVGYLVVLIITSDLLLNALINFSFAGVVPGTEIVIDPQSMLLGQTVLLGLIITIMLLIILKRRINYRRNRDAIVVNIAKVPKPQTKQIASKSIKYQTFQQIKKPAIELVTKRAISMIFDQTILLAMHKAMQQLQTVAVKFAVIVWLLCEIVYEAFKSAWKMLQPYAERFDTWLEIQYRASTKYVGGLFMRSERAQVAATFVRHGRQSFRRLFK